MKFTILTHETAGEASKTIFEGLEKSIGFLPNLYAFIGHSANALQNALTFQQGTAKGVFDAKQREAISLAVSQVNNCRYCQSSHTMLGKMFGFSDEEILQLRAGAHPDEKLNILATLSADIQQTHGQPSKILLDKFFELGYSQAALVDLVAVITGTVFANYINNMVEPPIDFPVAPQLASTQKGV